MPGDCFLDSADGLIAIVGVEAIDPRLLVSGKRSGGEAVDFF